MNLRTRLTTMNSLALPEVLDALPQFAPARRVITASVRRANRFLLNGISSREQPAKHWTARMQAQIKAKR